MQACRLRSHTVDVTPPQAATKIMAGMAEQQTEWTNGSSLATAHCARMAEWSNGGNGYSNGGNVYLPTILWYTPMTTPTTTTLNYLYTDDEDCGYFFGDPIVKEGIVLRFVSGNFQKIRKNPPRELFQNIQRFI
jgi:hypothetical protein